MFLGTTCVACGAPGDLLCAACGDQLQAATPFVCPAGLASCTALLDYRGVGRELVVGLKYRNARGVTARAGAALALALRQAPDLGPIDVVTWAPTSTARRRARGFDQAELLAQVVGLRLARPVVPLLHRVAGPPQTGHTRAERVHAPAFTATAPGGGPTPGRGSGVGLRRGRHRPELAAAHVLVVDDVLTTGATLTAAARALTDQGARTVHGAVLAHTRPPTRPAPAPDPTRMVRAAHSDRPGAQDPQGGFAADRQREQRQAEL